MEMPTSKVSKAGNPYNPTSKVSTKKELKLVLQFTVDKTVALSIDKIRASYASSIFYDDSELTQMMVVDACFILQVTYTLSEIPLKREKLFGIVYDLVLVGNQIPGFILQAIFDCTLMGRSEYSLSELILNLVNIVNVFETNIIVTNEYSFHHDHILGFMEKCYRRPNDVPFIAGLPSSEIHSTTELDRAGVIFKPNQDKRWPLAMVFKSSTPDSRSWSWGKPTLQMPVLRIHSFTEVVLRNLIAYEYASASPGFVTSYATAMDMLVDTQDDISKLIESKVVINHLGSSQTAANMINSLCKELPLLNFYYVEQWKQLDTHYNSYWPKNIASLKRTYFSSPWNIIALFAGIVLFVLTVLQTIAAF